MHSFGTPSVTPCLVIPLSCPALSTAPVVVAIGPAGTVPIGRGDSCGMVRSVRGPVGVVVWFGVRSFGSDFWVGVLGQSLGGLHRYKAIANSLTHDGSVSLRSINAFVTWILSIRLRLSLTNTANASINPSILTHETMSATVRQKWVFKPRNYRSWQWVRSTAQPNQVRFCIRLSIDTWASILMLVCVVYLLSR